MEERLVDIEQIFEHENHEPDSAARGCFETVCYCMLAAKGQLESVRRSLSLLATDQKRKSLKAHTLAVA